MIIILHHHSSEDLLSGLLGHIGLVLEQTMLVLLLLCWIRSGPELIVPSPDLAIVQRNKLPIIRREGSKLGRSHSRLFFRDHHGHFLLRGVHWFVLFLVDLTRGIKTTARK